MKLEMMDDGRVRLTLPIDKGNAFADAVMQHADTMRSPVLELAHLLREARYEARDHFRQPPDPWGGAQYRRPPSTTTRFKAD